jgi:uncharacterized protein involved in exopolysaccharide biosynthesis
MEEQKDLSYLKGVIRRRKRGFVLSFLSIFILAAVIAFTLPPVYRSQSTILIEEQQIPPEFVTSTITGYAEERLQVITQQVMSRSRLLEIINQFNLYRELRERHTTAEIIQKMRDNISLQTISAEVRDRRTGRPSTATIAFTLSFAGKNPSTVQKVATMLSSLYLEENLRSREARASSTTAFLQQESDEIKGQIERLQSRISAFKRAHIGELPEYNVVNMQAINRLSRDLDEVTRRLGGLRERKIYLEAQIANVDPLKPIVTPEGKPVMNPTERLKHLRLELTTLRSSLSEKHPDVKRLKKQIRELEANVEESEDSLRKVRRLKDLEGQLAAKKGEWGPKHPDVVRLSKEVEALSKEVEGLRMERVASRLAEEKPDNPAYISLNTQLASTDLEIKGLLEDKRQITEEMAGHERKIERAPLVEKEYATLMRDYDNAQRKYNEMMKKLMEARVAQGMEETQRGERFTIVDPAQLPEKPHKPNRIAIMAVGFILSLGLGVGAAAVRETLDTSVKTPGELTGLTGMSVLSVVSLMKTREEVRLRRIKWAAVTITGIVALCVAIYLVDHFVMPLEILWIKVQRRAMMLI